MLDNGIYTGHVRHMRVKPRKLSLRHACFWLALDIDRLDETADRLWNFSRNRFNLLSFHDCDHGDPTSASLRKFIEDRVAEAGFESPARIIMFCMPRVLGYGFNPISIYFCYDPDGRLTAIVYEVHNTFKQRHCYVAAAGPGERVVQHAEKEFYVSPFMDMDLRYTFKLRASDDQMLLAISAADADGPVIFTSLNATGKPLTPVALLWAWLTHPLLTIKVVGAIHFHALRLWLKGVRLRVRPPPPAYPATLGKPGKLSR